MEDRSADPRGRLPFARLRNRPTPELDSEALWQRVRSDLGTPKTRAVRSFAWALEPRWAAVGVIAAVALLAWALIGTSSGPGGELVLIGPAETAVAAAPEPAAGGVLQLDIRLVRGFVGDTHDSQPAGAGGADALLDVRETLEATLPYDSYSVLGTWLGDVGLSASPVRIELSPSHEVEFESEPLADSIGVRLTDVRLTGEVGPLLADELILRPGRTYLFGVRSEDSDEPGSLVLAVRVIAAADPVDSAPTDSQR